MNTMLLNKSLAVCSLISMLFVTGSGDRVQDEGPLPLSAAQRATVEAQARTFVAHYAKTIEGPDEDAIRMLYTDDGRFEWCSDGVLAYASADDILEALAKMPGSTFKTTFSETRVTPLTLRHASIRTAFATKIEIPGSQDFEFGGMITMVIEKDADGPQWQLLSGHTSTPSPRGKR